MTDHRYFTKPVVSPLLQEMSVVPGFQADQAAVMTSIEASGFGEITFNPPYLIEPGVSYGVIREGTTFSLWEFEAVDGSDIEMKPVREARRRV